MSTKSTISHGNTYHLYEEMFDVSNVYLEIEKVEFEASNNHVQVQIPIKIWRQMLVDWAQKGWPEDQDNEKKQISTEWLASLEELVRLREEEKTSHAKSNESKD